MREKSPDYTAMNAGEMLSALGVDAQKWAAAFMQHVAKHNGDFDEATMLGWFANAMMAMHDHQARKQRNPERMTGSEAVYGFVAWLTTRSEATTMGASHDCASLVPLITKFCETNGLDAPRERWTDYFQHPREEPKATLGKLRANWSAELKEPDAPAQPISVKFKAD